eukprot:7515496-Pyramimonas_sp.AAC.1
MSAVRNAEYKQAEQCEAQQRAEHRQEVQVDSVHSSPSAVPESLADVSRDVPPKRYSTTMDSADAVSAEDIVDAAQRYDWEVAAELEAIREEEISLLMHDRQISREEQEEQYQEELAKYGLE